MITFWLGFVSGAQCALAVVVLIILTHKWGKGGDE